MPLDFPGPRLTKNAFSGIRSDPNIEGPYEMSLSFSGLPVKEKKTVLLLHYSFYEGATRVSGAAELSRFAHLQKSTLLQKI